MTRPRSDRLDRARRTLPTEQLALRIRCLAWRSLNPSTRGTRQRAGGGGGGGRRREWWRRRGWWRRRRWRWRRWGLWWWPRRRHLVVEDVLLRGAADRDAPIGPGGVNDTSPGGGAIIVSGVAGVDLRIGLKRLRNDAVAVPAATRSILASRRPYAMRAVLLQCRADSTASVLPRSCDDATPFRGRHCGCFVPARGHTNDSPLDLPAHFTPLQVRMADP